MGYQNIHPRVLNKMITRNRFLIYLSTLILFIGCTSEEPDYNRHRLDNATYISVGTTNSNGDYAITFNNNSDNLSGVKRMRHNSTSGTGYDDFQLFTLCDTGIVMNPYRVEYNGTGWAYAGVGTQDTAWFYGACQAYDFLGIIPTNITATLNATDKTVQVSGVEAFVVKESTEDSPKEFLYTATTVQKGDYANGVSLNFEHGNAKVYFKFESDDPTCKILDFTPYNPGSPAVPGVPGTVTTKNPAKMFVEMADGKLVGYGINTSQETMGGWYAGLVGNTFNLNPYHGAYNYVTKERLEELMPLVNAQFIYTDIDNNYISNVDWVYGEDRLNKVFLKFADGVDPAEFEAGNDAFWTNLTPEEKTKMQNHHDSGCRIIRINKLADGNYFAWGETYGTTTPTFKGRSHKIINGGTIGQPAVPATGIQGFILLAATSVAGDGSDAIVSGFVSKANATVDLASTAVYAPVATVDRFVYEIPTTALSTKTASPSVLYSLPVKSVTDQGFTLKFSYVYKGDSVYDVRAYIPADKCVWQEGKKYTYNIKIQGLGNGKLDPTEADENDPVVGSNNMITIINVTVDDYTDGDDYDILINH